MPNTPYLRILIDHQDAEIGERGELGLKLGYELELDSDFSTKSASTVLGIRLPACKVNDRIFNTFHDPNVLDQSGSERFTNPRPCSIIVAGVELLTGKALLQSAGHTRLSEDYEINCYGQNGDWTINMQDLTLWDCLNPNPHNFSVGVVESSWTNFDTAGDGSDDFVYAPVRYRQPFTYTDANGITHGNDDQCNLYHMRPAISIYWLIVRAFQLLGYSINSNFFQSTYTNGGRVIPYFRRLVMPWTWGNFFDITGQVLSGLFFKAAGQTCITPMLRPPGSTYPTAYYGSYTGDWNAATSLWGTPGTPTTNYVFSRVSGGNYYNFNMVNVSPPAGEDEFGNYSFVAATGAMVWAFNPPTPLLPYLGSNLTLNFEMALIAQTESAAGTSMRVWVECTKTSAVGGVAVTTLPYEGLDQGSGGIRGDLRTQVPFNFQIANCNVGDTLSFRIKYNNQTGGDTLRIASSCWLNQNPSPDGYPSYILSYSTFAFVGIEITPGSPVHFRYYDKFRNFKFLDLLRGLIDLFHLSINTDPLTKCVTIEPTDDYVLPDGTKKPGYFSTARLDWTRKQDLSKTNTLHLYSETERQLDFSFKGDGSDGACNIWAQRYRGIYLNNKLINPVNIGNQENGIVNAIPGAGRYLLPERFRVGSRNFVNRFFSPVMHYRHTAWAYGGAAPQLICIFPENATAANNAYDESFEPKLAFYKGQVDALSGSWQWVGDPNAYGTGQSTYTFPGSTTRNLPLMFAVNYGYQGAGDPVLVYGNELIGGSIVPGLLKSYFLKRFATIRNGRLYKPYLNLTLPDFSNFLHREKIILRGGLWKLIAIDGFNPLSDDSVQCTLWQDTDPTPLDVSRMYPSDASVSTSPAELAQFDLKYAPKLLYGTDIPQV